MLIRDRVKHKPNREGVVYIVTDPSSANIFGIHQILDLRACNFTVHVICGQGVLKKKINDNVITINIIPELVREISVKKDLISFFKIYLLLNRLKPLVVIYATPKASLLGSVAGYFSKVPVRLYQIWGIRWANLSSLKKYFLKQLDFLAINLSTNVTSVSSSIIVEYNQYVNKHFEVLGKGSTIGVSKDNFWFDKDYLKPKSPKMLGYIGRISADKGISHLLDVFLILVKEFPDVILQIIGSEDISDEIDSSHKQLLATHPNIQCIGQLEQDKIINYLKNWEFQLFLSEREGLGNVILESAACGVPSICWDIVGVRDAQPPAMADLLVPLGQIGLVAEKARYLLKNPISLREKITMSRWVMDNFNQDLVSSNFQEYIKKVVRKLSE